MTTITTQTAKQTTTYPHQFQPRIYHALMVQMDISEKIVTISSPNGLSINVCYVDLLSGTIAHATPLDLDGDVRIHLVASEFPGWYYILRFSSYFQRYGCSCSAGKLFQYHRTPCEHMVMVAEQR